MMPDTSLSLTSLSPDDIRAVMALYAAAFAGAGVLLAFALTILVVRSRLNPAIEERARAAEDRLALRERFADLMQERMEARAEARADRIVMESIQIDLGRQITLMLASLDTMRLIASDEARRRIDAAVARYRREADLGPRADRDD